MIFKINRRVRDHERRRRNEISGNVMKTPVYIDEHLDLTPSVATNQQKCIYTGWQPLSAARGKTLIKDIL